MTDDARDDEERARELSRRQLLKQTGASLGSLALASVAVSCSDDGEPATPQGGEGICGGTGGESGSGGTSGGAGGAGGTSGSGAMGGASGTGGTSATGGSGGANAGAGGSGGSRDDAGTLDGGAIDGVRVAVVHRESLDEAVARAVELAGGLEAIQPGQSVFIKINGVSDRAIGTAGIRTSNEMIAAVVKLVKLRNPGLIVVGDRSARQFPDTMAVFENAGITQAALDAGADEVYGAPSPTQDASAWTLLQPEGYETTWSAAGGLLAMQRILDCDHLINVPTCKNHRYALFSLSMKNFIGAIGDETRGGLHFGDSIAADFEPIGRDIAVLNGMFAPLMNIVDATSALINGGPQGDSADAVRATPGLVLASRDRCALDAAAVSLIKLELGRTEVPTPDASHDKLLEIAPFAFPQIVHAAGLGLGVGTASEVELVFDDVADADALEAIFRS
jgi:uncharacterized protein (DUF362 family)